MLRSGYKIEVSTERDQHRRIPQQWVRHVAVGTLSAEKVAVRSKVEILLAGDDTVRALNHQYRLQDTVTDVLSFPGSQSDNEFPEFSVSHNDIGQVILSVPQAKRQADEAQIDIKKEAAHLIVHGILHLLDYDHENTTDGKLMHSRENAILYEIADFRPHSPTRGIHGSE